MVLYWYPKDDTPGCTKQACDIRDNWDKLKKAGVKVFGVSTQDNTSHKAFAEKHKLPFPLLPDEKGELAKKFGVPVVDGKARRITYLIGKDGKVKHVWPKAATTGHAAEILAVIEGKQAASSGSGGGRRRCRCPGDRGRRPHAPGVRRRSSHDPNPCVRFR